MMSHYVPPPGACDAHCHVFGPAEVFPFAPGRPYTPADSGKEELAALYAEFGLDRSVIVQAAAHGTDNAAMLDAVAADAGRRRGIALIDDSFDDQALEALHRGGVRGARFGFVRHLGSRPDIGFLRRMVARIAPLGWHAQVHLDAADLVELSEVLDTLGVTTVIDHMGRVDAAGGVEQPAFRTLLEQVRRDNCWVKLSGADRVSASGAPFQDALPFAKALIEVAPDRVVWGTDFPHVNPRHPSVRAETLFDLLPHMTDEAGLQRLLVTNPARLYGF